MVLCIISCPPFPLVLMFSISSKWWNKRRKSVLKLTSVKSSYLPGILRRKNKEPVISDALQMYLELCWFRVSYWLLDLENHSSCEQQWPKLYSTFTSKTHHRKWLISVDWKENCTERWCLQWRVVFGKKKTKILNVAT